MSSGGIIDSIYIIVDLLSLFGLSVIIEKDSRAAIWGLMPKKTLFLPSLFGLFGLIGESPSLSLT